MKTALAEAMPTAVPLNKESEAKCSEKTNRESRKTNREEAKDEGAVGSMPAPMATAFAQSAITANLTCAESHAEAKSVRNVEPRW